MASNKKIILISGLIGLGCGVFLSGIILGILVYTSSKTEPIHQLPSGQGEVEVAQESQIADNDQGESVDIEVDTIPKDEMVHLEIDSTATDTEIVAMLVEHDVISDHDEFMAYLVAMGAQRKLIHGNKKFPLGSDHAEILEILTRYK